MSIRHYPPRKRLDWKPAFLEALAATGLVSRAAEIAGIDPATAYRARDTRNRTGLSLTYAQQFAQRWDLALQTVADRIETEIFRRALQGDDQPRDIYYKGEKVGTQTIRRYSDNLLMFLAKAYRPDRFGRHWGLPGQPESAELTPESDPTTDLRQTTAKIAQQRWDELRPLVAERLALLEAGGSDDATPAAFNATPTPDNPVESTSPTPPNPTSIANLNDPNAH